MVGFHVLILQVVVIDVLILQVVVIDVLIPHVLVTVVGTMLFSGLGSFTNTLWAQANGLLPLFVL